MIYLFFVIDISHIEDGHDVLEREGGTDEVNIAEVR